MIKNILFLALLAVQTAVAVPQNLDRRADSDSTANTPSPAATPTPDPGSDSGDEGGFVNAIYYREGLDDGHKISNIEGQQITHIIYGFAKINTDGAVISGNSEADLGGTFLSDHKAGGNVRALFELKEKYKHLKIILSIGGPANSKAGQFGNIRQIDSGWRDFALSAVNLMYDWGFDGINIHWEYLKSDDASNLGLLLKVCREQLKERSEENNKYPYSLSMTTPGKYEQYKFLNFKEISDNVDFLFVKSYDYATDGEVYTISHSSNIYGDRSYGGNATLYSTDDALKYYLDGGASPKKIILGIPLHGRAFTRQGKGLGDVGLPKLNSDTKDGAYYYKDLPIGNEEVDEELIAAWSYNAKDKAIYSYDNVQTVAAKVHYIKEMKLGGVVFSEAYGDKKDEDSLVFTACRKLCNLDRSDNQLDYPGSRYINISNDDDDDDDEDEDGDEDYNKQKRAGIPQWKRANKGNNCRDLCSA